METLIVKNFGPISHAHVELNTITIFIGEGKGKSTIAKLFYIFNGLKEKRILEFEEFKQRLINFDIPFPILADTKIKYEHDQSEILVKASTIAYQNTQLEAYEPETIFIPAERLLLPAISESIFSILSNNIPLPKPIIEFASKFEAARNNLKKVYIEFLSAEYINEGGIDFIKFTNNSRVKLSQASNAFQSLIPLLITILNVTEKSEQGSFCILEQPEQSLSPLLQKKAIEFIVTKLNKPRDQKLLITTHSQYIISYLTLAIQAGLTYHKINRSASLSKDQLEKRLSEIVPYGAWLTDTKWTIYEFSESGGSITKLPHYLGVPTDDNSLNQSIRMVNELFDRLLEIEDEL